MESKVHSCRLALFPQCSSDRGSSGHRRFDEITSFVSTQIGKIPKGHSLSLILGNSHCSILRLLYLLLRSDRSMRQLLDWSWVSWVLYWSDTLDVLRLLRSTLLVFIELEGWSTTFVLVFWQRNMCKLVWAFWRALDLLKISESTVIYVLLEWLLLSTSLLIRDLGRGVIMLLVRWLDVGRVGDFS